MYSQGGGIDHCHIDAIPASIAENTEINLLPGNETISLEYEGYPLLITSGLACSTDVQSGLITLASSSFQEEVVIPVQAQESILLSFQDVVVDDVVQVTSIAGTSDSLWHETREIHFRTEEQQYQLLVATYGSLSPDIVLYDKQSTNLPQTIKLKILINQLADDSSTASNTLELGGGEQNTMNTIGLSVLFPIIFGLTEVAWVLSSAKILGQSYFPKRVKVFVCASRLVTYLFTGGITLLQDIVIHTTYALVKKELLPFFWMPLPFLSGVFEFVFLDTELRELRQQQLLQPESETP
ncbi:hypothetical protein [Endozoicomonas numazuensis]|uniref:Uncharacterized protein n=1 Tax=Endozoicomonas numazuensis TaxID=1137799 RepID=A0A081NGI9_9GAMM|nr:hypothetical protein [Endozoicomonas numazuensis]KEQ11358.1 hypothetical protein GZ78_29095 [Endozoicomonas numazuensis]KEQ17562.1 hypothetical protein GZ78_17640 [Endozoicomonas numazuensis]